MRGEGVWQNGMQADPARRPRPSTAGARRPAATTTTISSFKALPSKDLWGDLDLATAKKMLQNGDAITTPTPKPAFIGAPLNGGAINGDAGAAAIARRRGVQRPSSAAAARPSSAAGRRTSMQGSNGSLFSPDGENRPIGSKADAWYTSAASAPAPAGAPGTASSPPSHGIARGEELQNAARQRAQQLMERIAAQQQQANASATGAPATKPALVRPHSAAPCPNGSRTASTSASATPQASNSPAAAPQPRPMGATNAISNAPASQANGSHANGLLTSCGGSGVAAAIKPTQWRATQPPAAVPTPAPQPIQKATSAPAAVQQPAASAAAPRAPQQAAPSQAAAQVAAAPRPVAQTAAVKLALPAAAPAPVPQVPVPLPRTAAAP